MKHLLVSSLACLAGLALVVTSAPGSVRSNLVVLAKNGDPAPGTEGAVFEEFTVPCVINQDGLAVFKARLGWITGVIDTTNDDGIWAGRAGAWTLVAREKGPVPGLDTNVTFRTFSTVRLTEDGFLVLAATLQGTGIGITNDSCFLAGYPGSLRLLAREGDPAPGCAESETFGDLALLSARAVVCSRPREVFFRTALAGTAPLTSRVGLWGGAPGDLRLLARDATQAPGLPAGALIGNLQYTSPRVNPAGQFTINAVLSGTNVTLSDDDSLWVGTTNGLSLAFREGQPVGPAMPGCTFRQFRQPSLNERGEFCFIAAVNGTTNYGDDTVLLIGRPDDLRVIAQEGYPAPGLPAGVKFTDLFLTAPVWSRDGLVSFIAKVSAMSLGITNEAGIWIANTNALRQLCRPGAQAPGLPSGAIFHKLFSGTFDIPVLNHQGNLAFSSMLQGTGIDISNLEGLFAGPPHFLQLLLQRGDQVQLASNDFRTVFTMSFVDGSAGSEPSGGQDGRSRCLNDADQLIFAVKFQAGQGSALLLANDIQDPDGNNLPAFVERGLGLAPNESPAQALPAWTATNGQLRFTLRQDTNETLTAVALETRPSLLDSWQAVGTTNQVTTVRPANLPTNVEQREISIPLSTVGARFFRVGVRSLLWEKDAPATNGQ
jgi:hypothetical protein